MSDAALKTPKLDELEKGKWPSFVKEIKTAAEKSPMAQDLLGQLEKSYRDKIGYWKHGGIVGVMGYGGGVIGRYSSLPEEFPNVSHFHTIRVNQPAGWFYNTGASGNQDRRAGADILGVAEDRFRYRRLRIGCQDSQLLLWHGTLRVGYV
jgi:hypothetical protein